MKTVVVIGAGGMIGSALSTALLAKGHTVRGFGLGEQFLAQRERFEPLFATGRFTYSFGSIFDRFLILQLMKGADAVIHLAAMTGTRKTESEPLHCFDINVNGTQRVLECVVEAGMPHFVFASSSAVYGEPASCPVDEQAEVRPRNLYAITKLAGEQLVQGFAHEFPGFNYTIARIFNVYGESGNKSFAINAFVDAVLQGRPPVAVGDGSQRRCFTHVDDVARALMAMVETPQAARRTYNVGNPETDITIAGLAQRVIDVIAPASGLEVKFRPPNAELVGREIHSSVADITRACAELGYAPAIGLDEGLRRVAAAWRKETS